jgi:CDP-glucose 4,6-dehydratase
MRNINLKNEYPASGSFFERIYPGKKVLVTGHTGFKGSWLTLWLIELGAEVIGYSLTPHTTPSFFNHLDLKKHITHFVGDIRDFDRLKHVVTAYKPDMVFHLAAQALVKPSYIDPRTTYETNIMGTVNLLEAFRSSDSLKAMINVTSDKCYENKEWIYSYRENEPMGGYDPYSSSKGCSELVTGAYRNSYFNLETFGVSHDKGLASARAGNVIGGGDWSDYRLIPDCVRALNNQEAIIIRQPKAIRPWQFVLEPLAGYLLLGASLWKDRQSFSSAWNFGPYEDDIISVETIVQKLIRCWGEGEYRIEGEPVHHEAQLLKLDISKARYKLLWEPVYKIERAIQQTVNWYRDFYNNSEHIIDVSIEQIKQYCQTTYQIAKKCNEPNR